jgi:F0F1-type ATP synthase assembly protein I
VSTPPRESPDGDGEPTEAKRLAELPGLAAFAMMGTTIATCEGVGVVLGLWADHTWHSAPAMLIFGIVLGTVAAVWSVVQQVRRFL